VFLFLREDVRRCFVWFWKDGVPRRTECVAGSAPFRPVENKALLGNGRRGTVGDVGSVCPGASVC